MNVIVNSPVQFSCAGVGIGIVYIINATFATDENLVNKGFTQQAGIDILDNNLIRRNLSLTSAKISLNNTEIMCRVESTDGTYDYSPSSTLMIQGK